MRRTREDTYRLTQKEVKQAIKEYLYHNLAVSEFAMTDKVVVSLPLSYSDQGFTASITKTMPLLTRDKL